jgi:hypothetical protein
MEYLDLAERLTSAESVEEITVHVRVDAIINLIQGRLTMNVECVAVMGGLVKAVMV